MRRVVVVALVLTACASGNDVRGIVLEVDGSINTVDSFVLRSDDGETLTIIPSPDGDFSFPLPHLNDHRTTLSPIIVTLDRSVDPPLALAIRDADNPAWHESLQPMSRALPAIAETGTRTSNSLHPRR